MVENGDFFFEARSEPFNCLRCEGDLGNEHDGRGVLVESFLDCLKIDFGFAAPGNSIEEMNIELSFVEGVRYFF